MIVDISITAGDIADIMALVKEVFPLPKYTNTGEFKGNHAIMDCSNLPKGLKYSDPVTKAPVLAINVWFTGRDPDTKEIGLLSVPICFTEEEPLNKINLLSAKAQLVRYYGLMDSHGPENIWPDAVDFLSPISHTTPFLI